MTDGLRMVFLLLMLGADAGGCMAVPMSVQPADGQSETQRAIDSQACGDSDDDRNAFTACMLARRYTVLVAVPASALAAPEDSANFDMTLADPGRDEGAVRGDLRACVPGGEVVAPRFGLALLCTLKDVIVGVGIVASALGGQAPAVNPTPPPPPVTEIPDAVDCLQARGYRLTPWAGNRRR